MEPLSDCFTVQACSPVDTVDSAAWIHTLAVPLIRGDDGGNANIDNDHSLAMTMMIIILKMITIIIMMAVHNVLQSPIVSNQTLHYINFLSA